MKKENLICIINEEKVLQGEKAMLHFITGKVGCGKTTYLHSLLGKYVKEENADVILLVPKQFTFESDIGILDTLGAKDACKVEVLSFSRLADTVLKTCKGLKKPPLEDGANAVIMALALESVKDRLKFFARHMSNISFIKKMLSEIKEFKKNMITPHDLDMASKHLPDGILKEKTAETALIYETYNALVENSFYDDNDLLSLIYEILLDSDFLDGKIIGIDDFSRFTVQEIKIISLMMRRAKEVYVTCCSDNTENTDESSVFAVVNKTARRLKNEAAKYAVEVGTEILLTDEKNGFSTYLYPELRALEENIYKNSFSVYENEVSAVTLLNSQTVRDECDAVARIIKKLIRKGQYRCRDIAVVYRNEEPYEKEIRHSLLKYGVAVFEDKRQPIENEPLVIFTRSLLMICAEGFSTDGIMRLVKTGLFGTDTEEIASAENYALMWGLTGKDWTREWKDNPDGFGCEMNEKRKEELARLNETREKIVLPLESFKENMKDKNGKESMKELYEFLIENKIDENLKQYAITLEESGSFELAKEQEQVWDVLMNVLDKIACVTGEMSVSSKRLCEIFDLIISTESLGKLPDGFDEVYICGCDRIATIMPKVIFAVGANDGKFPQINSQNDLFAESEKGKLRTFLPDMKDGAKQTAMNERFMVYNTLCSARERLYISWALSDGAGEKLSESEFVQSVRKILPKVKTVNTSLQPKEELIESEKAAFELMASLWNENSSQSQTLKEYFSKKQEYKGKLEAIERAANRKQFCFENADTAKELFGKNIRLSASKLEDYELCPFKYFCKHEMKAQARKIAKLDPAQSGTLVHFVLEKLLSKYKGKSFLDAGKETLYGEVEKLLSEYIESRMGGMKDKSKRFNYLYSRTLKILCTIIDRLLCEFDTSDFEPCDFELLIDRDGKIQPFKVELEEGYIELRGIVDRVDKMEADGKRYIRVVDYKTGVKKFSLSDVLGGLGMQMLLYLVSIWRNGKDYYGENIVPAGVLYLPARFEPYNVDRSDSEEVLKNKRLSGGKMDGMILDEGEVIKGMDKSLGGMMIPIKVNKTGGISGNFISLSQLGKLAKKMDETMAQMGNELHKGHVPAKPAFGKEHGTTCDFCDFKSVCMRPEGVEFRYIENLKHGECLGIIEKEGERSEEKLD